jgi:hypothetical protein
MADGLGDTPLRHRCQKGKSATGPSDSQTTVAALMSAVWLEAVVVSMLVALSNTLIAIPIGAVGTLLVVDDMVCVVSVGWSSNCDE